MILHLRGDLVGIPVLVQPTLGGQLAVSAVEGVAGLAVQSQPLVLVDGAIVEVGQTGAGAGHLEDADLVVLRDLDSLVSSDTVSAEELLAVLAPGAGRGVFLTTVAGLLVLLLGGGGPSGRRGGSLFFGHHLWSSSAASKSSAAPVSHTKCGPLFSSRR